MFKSLNKIDEIYKCGNESYFSVTHNHTYIGETIRTVTSYFDARRGEPLDEYP